VVWSLRTKPRTEKRILCFISFYFRKLFQAKMKKKEKTEKKRGTREERKRVEREEKRVLIETGQSSFHLKAVILCTFFTHDFCRNTEDGQER
jgi:hypothetical protein